MNPLLKSFRESFREQLLSLLWRQWSSLGVAGYIEREEARLIDPEALLLFTCTLGRHESRLFDEVLDWMDQNGRFINVQRLKTIMRKEPFAGGKVAAAMADIMSRRAALQKWRRLSEEVKEAGPAEDLFFDSEGRPMELFGKPDAYFLKYGLKRGKLDFRGRSTGFNASLRCNLTYKLRALMGVSARSEILVYLLTHDSGHPTQIARDTYYYQKTVQDALKDMVRSGLIHVRASSREKHYWLNPEEWRFLLAGEKGFPKWINWPLLFGALEEVWLKISDAKLHDLDPLLLSSEIRGMMQRVKPRIQQAGFLFALSDESAHPGESYLRIFVADMGRLSTMLLEP